MDVAVRFSTFYIEDTLKIKKTPSQFTTWVGLGTSKDAYAYTTCRLLQGSRECISKLIHEKNKLSICSGILIARMFLRK